MDHGARIDVMRALSIATVLLTATLAGCIASDDEAEPSEPAPTQTQDDSAETEAERAERLNRTLEGHREFCTDEAACNFWDQDYHEVVVYDLDTYVFDVVIVPPAGGTTPDNIAASRQAVQAWSDGIAHYAASWLNDSFVMNVYAVGIDVPSIDAVQDPEIIVISTSAAGLAGIGLAPLEILCPIAGAEGVADLGGHWHDNNYIGAMECAGIGFTCFALNAGALDAGGLYDLIAHEVGHCLGAGHVGDALDFRARYAPVEDIMSYQSNETQVHCVSNMNVRVLEGVYAHLLGRPAEEQLEAFDYFAMSPLDYEQVECANPPGM